MNSSFESKPDLGTRFIIDSAVLRDEAIAAFAPLLVAQQKLGLSAFVRRNPCAAFALTLNKIGSREPRVALNCSSLEFTRMRETTQDGKRQ